MQLGLLAALVERCTRVARRSIISCFNPSPWPMRNSHSVSSMAGLNAARPTCPSRAFALPPKRERFIEETIVQMVLAGCSSSMSSSNVRVKLNWTWRRSGSR
jgi:hypothetical protein